MKKIDDKFTIFLNRLQREVILQNEKIPNFCTTSKETFSQTNSQDPTSQQEANGQGPRYAIARKYQPVEVLNSEGKWVSGYFVHKCFVVANLERVERKYALVDEKGEKYAFWGEI